MCLGTENSCQVQRIPTAKTTVRACAYMPLSLLSGRLWGDDIKGGAKYQRWELWQRKHIHKSHLISMCLWIPSLVSKHILEKKVEDTRVISSCLGPNSHLRNPCLWHAFFHIDQSDLKMSHFYPHTLQWGIIGSNTGPRVPSRCFDYPGC